MSHALKVPAQWEPDCQGKWDFDGRLVSLSTRYWRDKTAKSTIYLGSTKDEFYNDAVVLIEQEFSGETEAECKRQVEVWAAEQYSKIADAIRAVYTRRKE